MLPLKTANPNRSGGGPRPDDRGLTRRARGEESAPPQRANRHQGILVGITRQAILAGVTCTGKLLRAFRSIPFSTLTVPNRPGKCGFPPFTTLPLDLLNCLNQTTPSTCPPARPTPGRIPLPNSPSRGVVSQQRTNLGRLI